MKNKDFYRAFEDAHRGSRELIKERISVYLPFILPLQRLYPEGLALDIGCGRGEWLELLNEHNISAQGVDLDAGMLEACKTLGLAVEQGDGITYLKKQENESFIVISAFHVVEHISFEELQTFIEEALRVLKPGGLLIMETPNPENIKVATENFYLDPTHERPIPSKLLSFLTEFYGFKRTKVLRLQESKELMSKENIDLRDVIEGVSSDYAVIAQKDASKDVLEHFDKVFSQEFGLSLTALTEKFENRLTAIETKATQAEQRATEAEAKAMQAERRATEAETKATQAEQEAHNAWHHYHLVVNSNSWKLTYPFRKARRGIKWFTTGVYHWVTFSPTSRPRRVLQRIMLDLKYFIYRYPKIKKYILKIMDHFPSLKDKVKLFIHPEPKREKISISPKEIDFFNRIKKEVEDRKQHYIER